MDSEGFDMTLRKLVTDVLTENDNKTYDHGKILGFTSFIFYYALAFASLWGAHPWQAMDFASGVGTMAVGFGVHFKLKGNELTEDKKDGTV
jgi:small-conductance mechanosensitive channel